jgi:subtilisin family serine protease
MTKKPEVAAPGVQVYSSVPGGGYEQNGWDGTSMAGPHVAGVVALMRQADPNLDVDSIKQILMRTAVDLGTSGEDNDYGWGIIDAYAAVSAVMFKHGDADRNGTIDIADVVLLINYLFANGPAPSPLLAGDANCDGEVNIEDVVYLANYLFISGPQPPC